MSQPCLWKFQFSSSGVEPRNLYFFHGSQVILMQLCILELLTWRVKRLFPWHGKFFLTHLTSFPTTAQSYSHNPARLLLAISWTLLVNICSCCSPCLHCPPCPSVLARAPPKSFKILFRCHLLSKVYLVRNYLSFLLVLIHLFFMIF